MEQYIGRIVAVLVGPIVIGASAWFSTWAAKNLPGAPNIPAKELGELAVGGALASALLLYKWLDNRGKQEVLAQAKADTLHDPPVETSPPDIAAR